MAIISAIVFNSLCQAQQVVAKRNHSLLQRSPRCGFTAYEGVTLLFTCFPLPVLQHLGIYT